MKTPEEGTTVSPASSPDTPTVAVDGFAYAAHSSAHGSPVSSGVLVTPSNKSGESSPKKNLDEFRLPSVGDLKHILDEKGRHEEEIKRLKSDNGRLQEALNQAKKAYEECEADRVKLIHYHIQENADKQKELAQSKEAHEAKKKELQDSKLKFDAAQAAHKKEVDDLNSQLDGERDAKKKQLDTEKAKFDAAEIGHKKAIEDEKDIHKKALTDEKEKLDSEKNSHKRDSDKLKAEQDENARLRTANEQLVAQVQGHPVSLKVQYEAGYSQGFSQGRKVGFSSNLRV